MAFVRCRKSRGGTPSGERAPLSANRARWRGSLEKYASGGVPPPFISFVARVSAAKPGSGLEIRDVVPDFASLHPGYGSSDPIVMEPVTTAGFI